VLPARAGPGLRQHLHREDAERENCIDHVVRQPLARAPPARRHLLWKAGASRFWVTV